MRWITAVAAGLSVACIHVPPVEHASEGDSISTFSMSCTQPYDLSRDCSESSGAQRLISVRGFEIAISANDSGTVVLVMDAEYLKNTLLPSRRQRASPFESTNAAHSHATNKSYLYVRFVLDQARVSVKKVRAVTFWGSIDGYVLELESDGYSALLAHRDPE